MTIHYRPQNAPAKCQFAVNTSADCEVKSEPRTRMHFGKLFKHLKSIFIEIELIVGRGSRSVNSSQTERIIQQKKIIKRRDIPSLSSHSSA
jgi:hypothetical protein